MQPVRITIPGSYWDCQLYSGHLYLFTDNKALRVIAWDRLLELLPFHDDQRFVARCAFQEGQLLYKYGANDSLLSAPPVLRAVKRSFFNLARIPYEITDLQIDDCTECCRENPFPFPHSDTEIYDDTLFVASKSGLSRLACEHWYPEFNFDSPNVVRFWDCPVFSVTASYSTLALGAGGDGLWEVRVFLDRNTGKRGNDEVRLLSRRHCTTTNWNYQSIYGSSPISEGCFAEFKKRQIPDSTDEITRREYVRELIETYSSSQIFNKNGRSWANANRFCMSSDGRLDVVNYTAPRKGRMNVFRSLGSVLLTKTFGSVIGGAIAPFGIIVEFEHGLSVIPSDGGHEVHLDEEPVRWRFYPRSKLYQNQLHVIFDDRLEVYSFNHDFFVEQSKKLAGSRPLSGRVYQGLR